MHCRTKARVAIFSVFCYDRAKKVCPKEGTAMKKRLLVLLFALALTLSACGQKSVSRTVYAMDTVMMG